MLKFRQFVRLLVLLVALTLIVNSLWIPAKAICAELLINYSWQQSIAQGKRVKPWPWADHYPVAKLSFHRLKSEVMVLMGADPSTLAFSAGLMHQYSNLKQTGPTAIAGHKDTHFSLLKEVAIGDVISLTNNKQNRWNYTVSNIEIIDSNKEQLVLDKTDNSLVLITCFPFHLTTEQGNLRYVVTAHSNSI